MLSLHCHWSPAATMANLGDLFCGQQGENTVVFPDKTLAAFFVFVQRTKLNDNVIYREREDV